MTLHERASAYARAYPGLPPMQIVTEGVGRDRRDVRISTDGVVSPGRPLVLDHGVSRERPRADVVHNHGRLRNGAAVCGGRPMRAISRRMPSITAKSRHGWTRREAQPWLSRSATGRGRWRVGHSLLSPASFPTVALSRRGTVRDGDSTRQPISLGPIAGGKSRVSLDHQWTGSGDALFGGFDLSHHGYKYNLSDDCQAGGR